MSYTYDCEGNNSLFLEELAKYILRKPSRFHALSGNVVPDDTLAKIHRQLAQRKAEREQELEENSVFCTRIGIVEKTCSIVYSENSISGS